MNRTLIAAVAALTLTSGAAFAQGLQPSGTRAGGTGQYGASGEILPEQRVYLHNYVMGRPGPVVAIEDEMVPGFVVPRSVRLSAFDRDAYGTYPDARRYRYFRTDENVVLVDPRTRRVVEVIED